MPLIFLEGLRKADDKITKFYIPARHALVEYARGMADNTIVFQMRNGSTITVPIEVIKCSLKPSLYYHSKARVIARAF